MEVEEKRIFIAENVGNAENDENTDKKKVKIKDGKITKKKEEVVEEVKQVAEKN